MNQSIGDRKVFGKMPDLRGVIWTPSRRFAWWGQWERDARFSVLQLLALCRRKMDPETCEAIEVRREVGLAEYQPAIGEWLPLCVFDCPVIGRSGNRVRVIAPDGGESLIRSDGWAHKPSSRPYQGSYW